MSMYRLKFNYNPSIGDVLDIYYNNSGKTIKLFSMICAGNNNVYHIGNTTTDLDTENISVYLRNTLVDPSDYTIEAVDHTIPWTDPRKKLFVIAGNMKEYQEFVASCAESGRYNGYMPMYVSSANILRGTIDPEGTCIGTWKERLDIVDILETLIICCKNINKQRRAVDLLHMIQKQYKGSMQWSIDNFGSPNGA